jgi:hypothetical protein
MERLTAAESIRNLPAFREAAMLLTLAARVEVSASSPLFSRAANPESCRLSPAPVATGAVSAPGLLTTFPVAAGGVDGVATFSVNPFSFTLIGIEILLGALFNPNRALKSPSRSSYLTKGEPPKGRRIKHSSQFSPCGVATTAVHTRGWGEYDPQTATCSF